MTYILNALVQCVWPVRILSTSSHAVWIPCKSMRVCDNCKEDTSSDSAHHALYKVALYAFGCMKLCHHTHTHTRTHTHTWWVSPQTNQCTWLMSVSVTVSMADELPQNIFTVAGAGIVFIYCVHITVYPEDFVYICTVLFLSQCALNESTCCCSVTDQSNC